MQTAYLLTMLAGTAWLAWRGRTTAAGLLLSVGLIAYCGFSYMPWWVMFAGVGWLAWRHAGWRFALVACAMVLAITLTGHWQGALYSVYLCSAAILVCMLIGCPLGILAAKSDLVSGILRPVNDTLQSIPLYIFLIPAVALFQVNEFSALVAIVLYAIVPLIRYTEHGLRHVPPTLVEAARANGCSPLQRLLMIELPVARPAILLGLNQTVLFALAMLIIAVLVGARGLAEQVNIGLRDADTGLGMTAWVVDGLHRYHRRQDSSRLREFAGHDRHQGLAADHQAGRNRGRCRVQRVAGEPGGGLVARHEFLTLVPRHDGSNILELAAAPVIHQIEKAEGPRPTVAEHDLRHRPAQLLVIGGERRCVDPVFDEFRTENPGIDDGLARTV